MKSRVGTDAATVHPGALLVGCIFLFGAIGFFDWLTGAQLRVFPLYFVPILLVASRLSRGYALASAAIATVIWVTANSLVEDATAIAFPIQAANAVTMFAAFAIVAVLFAEVRERLRAEERSSRTDPLTQLPNRRGFLERADVLIAAGRRSARSMTLAYIDLDHFKAVNDEQGHAAGDAALRLIANLLVQATRVGDIIGRLGGDEFGALFPDTTVHDAQVMLERVRGQIADQMRERGWPITASIGAITFSASSYELSQAIGAADATMYAVKQGGRNRVQVDEPKRPS